MRFRVALAVVVFACLAAAADKPRVFVAESDSWQVSGSAAGADAALGGSVGGGARPQTVEIMKTFTARCSAVAITLNRSKADYVVMLQHEGGKHSLARDNKVAVFNRDEELIHTSSTRSLGNAVKGACAVITGQPVK